MDIKISDRWPFAPVDNLPPWQLEQQRREQLQQQRDNSNAPPAGEQGNVRRPRELCAVDEEQAPAEPAVMVAKRNRKRKLFSDTAAPAAAGVEDQRDAPPASQAPQPGLMDVRNVRRQQLLHNTTHIHSLVCMLESVVNEHVEVTGMLAAVESLRPGLADNQTSVAIKELRAARSVARKVIKLAKKGLLAVRAAGEEAEASPVCPAPPPTATQEAWQEAQQKTEKKAAKKARQSGVLLATSTAGWGSAEAPEAATHATPAPSSAGGTTPSHTGRRTVVDKMVEAGRAECCVCRATKPLEEMAHMSKMYRYCTNCLGLMRHGMRLQHCPRANCQATNVKCGILHKPNPGSKPHCIIINSKGVATAHASKR